MKQRSAEGVAMIRSYIYQARPTHPHLPYRVHTDSGVQVNQSTGAEVKNKWSESSTPTLRLNVLERYSVTYYKSVYIFYHSSALSRLQNAH